MRSQVCLRVTIFYFLVGCLISPPPRITTPEEPTQEDDFYRDIHFSNYLQQILEVVRSDEEGINILDKISQVNGELDKFTDEFKLKSKEAYEELNRLKNLEIERLTSLENENDMPDKYELLNTDKEHFDREDLIKLVKKTIELISQKQDEMYKNYEMQKKFNETLEESHMSPEQRAAHESEERIRQEAHKKHLRENPTHEPLGHQQLQEVNEEVEHFDNFDPRDFFFRHDLDGNSKWDEEELATIIEAEVKKEYMDYNQTDPIEKEHYRDEMKKEALQRFDKNKDLFISLQEFLDEYAAEGDKETPHPERENSTVYTHEEYEKMAKELEQSYGQMTTQTYQQYYHGTNGTHSPDHVASTKHVGQ